MIAPCGNGQGHDQPMIGMSNDRRLKTKETKVKGPAVFLPFRIPDKDSQRSD